jgi:hypothetical protein
MLHKRDRTIIVDELDRFVVDRRKTGTQGFMSIDEGLKAFLKRRDIHDPSQSHFDENVVGGAFQKELVEKPQPFLGKGRPKMARTFRWQQRNSLAQSLGIFDKIEKFNLILPDF